jgi:uncharacterized protein YycO
MLRALFTSHPVAGSKLIRLLSTSSFSHCGLVTPEGTVIEAVTKIGVREQPLASSLVGVSASVLVDCRNFDADECVARARSQLGRSYDWRGCFGFSRPDFWYCSELLAYALGHSVKGDPILSPEEMFQALQRESRRA